MRKKERTNWKSAYSSASFLFVFVSSYEYLFWSIEESQFDFIFIYRNVFGENVIYLRKSDATFEVSEGSNQVLGKNFLPRNSLMVVIFLVVHSPAKLIINLGHYFNALKEQINFTLHKPFSMDTGNYSFLLS